MVANRNIWLISIYTICTNAIFVLPVIVPYMNSIGISFKQFLIGEAIFSAAVLLAEVPSGWISDVWRRRATLILGLFFGVLGFVMLTLADSFFDVVMSQATIGIAVALNSGTVSALLYDTLLAEGREDEFHKHQGRIHGIGLYSVAAACLIGGVLFQIDAKLPLFFNIIIYCVGMIAVAFVHEPPRFKRAPEKNMFRDIIETARYALHGHKEIAGIIMVSMVVFCATKLFLWAQQPYYEMVGIPVAWFGVIMAGIYLFSGSAGVLSHHIERFGSNRAKLIVMTGILITAALLLWAIPNPYLAISLFAGATMIFGLGFPVVQNAINVRVGSERRATILSTASLMIHIMFIPTSICLAFIEGATDIRTAMLALGMQVAVMAGFGLWLWKPQKDVTGPALS